MSELEAVTPLPAHSVAVLPVAPTLIPESEVRILAQVMTSEDEQMTARLLVNETNILVEYVSMPPRAGSYSVPTCSVVPSSVINMIFVESLVLERLYASMAVVSDMAIIVKYGYSDPEYTVTGVPIDS